MVAAVRVGEKRWVQWRFKYPVPLAINADARTRSF
jgi:hypothetical protein